jgi:hypothetical protein
MTTGKSAPLILVMLLVSVCLYGCKDKEEAREVLPKVCPHFPDSVIYKFDKRVLWIQTNVDGISGETAEDIFQQACQQAAYKLGKLTFNISAEMKFDDRSILIIGFKQYLVAWEVRNGVDQRGIPRGYEVMNWNQAPSWFMQHLGYRPLQNADQIYVITLQDVQQTPQGQPMQLQTLAQLQQQRKQ